MSLQQKWRGKDIEYSGALDELACERQMENYCCIAGVGG